MIMIPLYDLFNAKYDIINSWSTLNKLCTSYIIPHTDLLHRSNQSNILPSSSPILVSLGSHSGEPKTVLNISRGHRSILQGGKNLPLLRRTLLLHRTSHEARGTLALVDVVTERLAGGVFKGTHRGAGTSGCRVGGSKAEGTVVVNVNLLTTGDRNILLPLAHHILHTWFINAAQP